MTTNEKVVKKNKLETASDEARNDKKIVLEAVSKDGMNLRFASERLSDDEEVVRCAVSECGLAVEFASERLKDNLVISILATKQNGLALAFLSENMCDTYEVVMTAVSQNGKALAYASKKLKDNEDIVLEAIRNDPYSLKFASKRIRDIKKYVLMTLEGEGKFDFVGVENKWFCDPVFMFEGVKITKKLLSKFDRNYLTRDMVMMFIKRDGLALEFFPDHKDDFEIVKLAVSQNGMALKFASEKLCDNLEIALTAMAKDIESSRYIGNNVRKYLREIPDRYPNKFFD